MLTNVTVYKYHSPTALRHWGGHNINRKKTPTVDVFLVCRCPDRYLCIIFRIVYRIHHRHAYTSAPCPDGAYRTHCELDVAGSDSVLPRQRLAGDLREPVSAEYDLPCSCLCGCDFQGGIAYEKYSFRHCVLRGGAV